MRLPRLKAAATDSRKSLHRELIVALAIKAVALFALWLAFFSRPQVTDLASGMAPARVAAAIVAPAAGNRPPPQGNSQ